jgi:hypothetical protein
LLWGWKSQTVNSISEIAFVTEFMRLWGDFGKIGGLAGFCPAGFRLKPIYPDFIKGNVHKEKSMFFRDNIR